MASDVRGGRTQLRYIRLTHRRLMVLKDKIYWIIIILTPSHLHIFENSKSFLYAMKNAEIVDNIVPVIHKMLYAHLHDLSLNSSNITFMSSKLRIGMRPKNWPIISGAIIAWLNPFTAGKRKMLSRVMI